MFLDDRDEIEVKALNHIAEQMDYDLSDMRDWLKAEMIDMLDYEMCAAVDGPMIYGDPFVVVRDPGTGRWKAQGGE